MNTISIKSIKRDRFGIFLPESEVEIITLVHYARKQRRKLRVMGSLHSIPQAILTNSHEQGIHLSLDFMNHIAVADSKRRLVSVQGGCRIDYDPYSLSGNSSHDNGLVQFLDRLGWALPDLGGITHQSLAGFLSTGSAGGSLAHSVYDQIRRVRIVDGAGILHEIDLDNPLFGGAIVSLGLIGIITEVTLECVPRFDIIGKEAVLRIADAPLVIGKRNKDSRPKLTEFLSSKEYARMMWWPQSAIQKLVVWEAERMTKTDTERLCHYGATSPKLQKYRQMGAFPNAANFLAGQYLQVSGNSLFNAKYPAFFRKRAEGLLRLLNFFIIADSEKKGKRKNRPQYFNDTWWHGLPMDYEMDDYILPTEFTELWVPAKYANDAMQALSNHYATHGARATGSYCCEIYAAKQSKQWLSPAFGTDVVRFDFFWFAKIKADPNVVFFPQFWDLLKKYKFRCHWGKFMPPRNNEWKSFISRSFPKWKSFTELRRQMDPDNIFLSDYWGFYFA